MNKIIELTKELNAPESVSKSLLAKMESFFSDAEKKRDLIDSIVITSPDEVSKMQQAREIRLEIKRKRITARDIVKKERDKIKSAMADFTLQDKLWLKSFQMLEAICENLETKCEDKEKFAERYEAEQKKIRYQSRLQKIFKYVTDPSIYNLADMDDESFNKLLENEKQAYELRIKAEKDAELKRLAEEKAEIERQEAIRIENEKLKKELAKERAEQAKKLDAERKAKEEAEAKLRAEKDRLEAIEKQKEEDARKKLLAPDKDKLMELANIIDLLQLPAVNSKEANSIVKATEEMLKKVTNYIREKAKTL
jgi:hypothetical protein